MTTLKNSIDALKFIAYCALLIVIYPKIVRAAWPILTDISEIIVKTVFAPLTTFIELLAKFQQTHGTGTTLVLVFTVFITLLVIFIDKFDTKTKEV
ncbi:hypothetical protein [Pseudomonas juntendi]|uniref:hypothetical protein n=1 Tax=Pseudomonas juntendi TaxID=2666183 RepID=UPI003452A879